MHKYRHAARYQAWYDDEDDGGVSNYNPFKKPRSRVSDPENLRRRVSDPGRVSERVSDGVGLPEVREFDEGQHIHEQTRPEKEISRHSTRQEEVETRKNRNLFSRIFDLDLAAVRTTEGSGFANMGSELIGIKAQLSSIFWGSWTRRFLFTAPPALVVGYLQGQSSVTFVLNFIAIIPLTSMAGFAGDEVSLRTGIGVGSLFSVTISNISQLVSSGLLLRSRQVQVLRTSLIGGILCTILLVLGLSFLIGGYDKQHQQYNLTLAHTSANLLSLASTSLVVPTVSRLLKQTSDANIARQSRGAAVLLLIVYFAYIDFQLYTHNEDIEQPDPKTAVRPRASAKISSGSIDRALAKMGAGAGAQVGEAARLNSPNKDGEENEDEDEDEDETFDEDRKPQLSLPTAMVALASSTSILYFTSDLAVNSIDTLISESGIPQTFIGLILLPLLNNFDSGPVKYARLDRLSVTIRITVGKCLQTALFITPLMVIAGWAMGIDTMTLYFDGFEVASIFASVILLNYLVMDARATWIQGVLLMCDWGMIALAAFFVDD